MACQVRLRISNRQKIAGNSPKEDYLKYEGKGNLYFKNRQCYLVYQDFSEGIAGARTTIKIDPETSRIFLLRGEPAPMHQSFEVGRVTNGVYGDLSLEVKTKALELDIFGEKGKIFIQYSLYLNGHYTSENNLKISWSLTGQNRTS